MVTEDEQLVQLSSIAMDEESVQDYELDSTGTCTSCHNGAHDMEFVQCRLCKKCFHVICTMSTLNDDKWATKSMITNFKASSTKKNFMFMCNCCLTTLENNLADVDGQRIRKMERNMALITNELAEIKKLVSVNNHNPPVTANPSDSTVKSDQNEIVTKIEKPVENIWHDTERLASVKAKPAESVLVISKGIDSVTDKNNTDLVENMVIEGRIPVKKSFKNKNGNLVVVCDSEESRNSLVTQVSGMNSDIEMKMPKENRPTVSIVGLNKMYEKQEIINLLVQQNYFLGQFAEKNNIEDHISVFGIKPLRGKEDVFQAFARVSKVVRQGFRTYNDKVMIGLSSCQIYDQYHIKRCNNCQAFGHFYKDCPDLSVQVCAICSGDHSTRVCSSTTPKCINCIKGEKSEIECQHRADDRKCPSLLKEQEKLKKNLNV